MYPKQHYVDYFVTFYSEFLAEKFQVDFDQSLKSRVQNLPTNADIIKVWKSPQSVKTPLEILEVITCTEDTKEYLWGYWLDSPQPGEHYETVQIWLRGWILGKRSKVVAIEVSAGDGVIQKVPVDFLRPDVALDYPQVSDAVKCGFKVVVDVGSLPDDGKLILQGVFEDGECLRLNIIKWQKLVVFKKEDSREEVLQQQKELLLEENQAELEVDI